MRRRKRKPKVCPRVPEQVNQLKGPPGEKKIQKKAGSENKRSRNRNVPVEFAA